MDPLFFLQWGYVYFVWKGISPGPIAYGKAHVLLFPNTRVVNLGTTTKLC